MTALTLPSLTDVLAQDGPARVDRSWWSWAGPHGGLVAALALRSARSLVPADRSPRALTVQLLRALDDRPATARPEAVAEGRSSTVTATRLLDADGRLAVTATLTSGLSRPSGAPLAAVPPPAVPGPDDCAPLALPVELVPYGQHLEHRPATPVLPLAGGSTAELVAWARLRADDPLDSAALTVLADAMPPALYGVATLPVPVPTVELSVAYAPGLDEAPRRGWVLVRIATRTAGDGWCVDDSEVWAPDGTLLVQARQTRRVLGELS